MKKSTQEIVQRTCGRDSDDIIIGGGANDALSGENGNDLIDGGAGNDLIRGGRGQDQLLGGAGDDQGVTLNLVLAELGGVKGGRFVKAANDAWFDEERREA